MVRLTRPYQEAVAPRSPTAAAATAGTATRPKSPGRAVRSPGSPSSRRKKSLSATGESAEEIQRKIEELQRQIAMMQKSPKPEQPSNAPNEPRGEQVEEVYEEYEEEVTETEHEVDGDNKQNVPPQSPSGRYGSYGGGSVGGAPPSPTNSAKSPSSPSWRDRRKPSVTASPTAAPAGHHDAYRKQMEDLKQKFAFEKPGWAAPAEVVQREEEIDRESIQNPNLKQAQMGGYQRQVKEKEIDLVRGTFVKDTPKATEPRLAWIVLNVGKRKAGKIVMHLYGRDVHRLVDQFLELKGHEVTRDNSQTLTVQGMDPALHVLSTRATAGLDAKAGVFGIIQEGHDVFQTVMEASEGLSVKQSHIFPVVKGKKEFAKN